MCIIFASTLMIFTMMIFDLMSTARASKIVTTRRLKLVFLKKIFPCGAEGPCGRTLHPGTLRRGGMPPAPRGPGPWFLDFGLNTRVPFRFFHFYLVKNRIVQQPSLFMFIFHSFSLFFFSCYCLSFPAERTNSFEVKYLLQIASFFFFTLSARVYLISFLFLFCPVVFCCVLLCFFEHG